MLSILTIFTSTAVTVKIDRPNRRKPYSQLGIFAVALRASSIRKLDAFLKALRWFQDISGYYMMVIVRKIKGKVRIMEFHNVEWLIRFLSCYKWIRNVCWKKPSIPGTSKAKSKPSRFRVLNADLLSAPHIHS